MVVIPAIEDAIRSAHSATSPEELEQALGMAESLAHHAMTETIDEEVRQYSADVLMRIAWLRRAPMPRQTADPVSWVHLILAGGETLLQQLQGVRDVQAGFRLIDDNKERIDDRFFSLLEEEIVRIHNSGTIAEYAKAHRFGLWRLHASLRYYYARILRDDKNATGPPTVLGYAGDKNQAAKCLLLLSETFDHFSRFDLIIKCCADAELYGPAPEIRSSVLRARAEAEAALGVPARALASWRELGSSIMGQSDTARMCLIDSYRGQARSQIALGAFDQALSILTYAHRTLGPVDFLRNRALRSKTVPGHSRWDSCGHAFESRLLQRSLG